MKNLVILLWALSMIAMFKVGEIEGRFEGPRLVHWYIEPPSFWGTPMNCNEPAIWMKDDGWHEGREWNFKNIEVDEDTHTVSGLCGDKGK